LFYVLLELVTEYSKHFWGIY